MSRRLASLSALSALSVMSASLLTSNVANAQVAAHQSENHLPSSNGLGTIAYNVSAAKLDQFLEHPYAFPTSTTTTRNFAYDSYPGVRVGAVGTAGVWLNTVTPTRIEYLAGTGIIHVVHSYSGLTVEEFHFTPIGLTTANASVTLLKVTRTSGDATQPVDAYNLYNYHLGSGSPSPGVDGEGSTYDGTPASSNTSAHDAIYEYGNSNVVLAYSSIGQSTHHGMGSNNPYNTLLSGGNLDDTNSSSGIETVPAFQTSLGTIANGATAWAGWFTALSLSSTGGSDVRALVQTWINGRTPAQLLAAEQSAWATWVKPIAAASGALETALANQAQVTLKMGQVTEPNTSSAKPNGQILASVAPGTWNISWVRDMAYSVNGLIASGHLAEAKAALQFQMSATVGSYQSQVGGPYAISVVRYFGNGTEQSDSNQNGPNIEFDGFGLFLWSLDQYVRASGDTAFLTSVWPTVKANVASTLVNLQDASTGLIAADSSIWEVHWNGQQRHFAYTTITAANGLCAASHLATLQNDATDSTAYLTAGQKARDAILTKLRAPDGTIAQSTEGLAIGHGFLDAATLEAINFGLIDPSKRTANATLASMKRGLVPMEGHGFMRSDVGDTYSSQEWIFVDLRSARAFELTGDSATATTNFLWNVDQAMDNFGELSELHDAVTADYSGQSPMVGFGAGAYLLRLVERGEPLSPACGSFAAEPDSVIDAGAGDGAGDDGGVASGDDSDSGSTGTGPNGSFDGGTFSAADGAVVAVALNGSDGSTNGASAGDDSSGGCAIAAASSRDGETDRGAGRRDLLPIVGVLAALFAGRRKKHS